MTDQQPMDIATHSLVELAKQCALSAKRYTQAKNKLTQEPFYSLNQACLKACDYFDIIQEYEPYMNDVSQLAQFYQQQSSAQDRPIHQVLEQYMITSWDTVLDSFEFDPTLKSLDPLRNKMLHTAVKVIAMKIDMVDKCSKFLENTYLLIAQHNNDSTSHLPRGQSVQPVH